MSIDQVRALLKHISLPKQLPDGYDLSEHGLVPLATVPPPAVPEGYELFEGEPVGNTQQWLLLQEGLAATQNRQRHAEATALINEAKADGLVQNFIGMNHAQVANYIDTNVVDLDSAKTVLKLMAKMLLIMAKRQYGGPQ
jgi:hypothetical protein